MVAASCSRASSSIRKMIRLGVAHSFLSKCEMGDRRVDVLELIQLEKLYGKSPQYFLSADQ